MVFFTLSNIILLSASVASLGGIIYLVSRKIPLLLSIPENIISESFVVRPSRFKQFFEVIKEYFLDRKYERPFLSFGVWLLRRLRIIFLKFEHFCFRALRSAQERQKTRKIPKARREYLKSIEEKEGGNGKSGSGYSGPV